MSQTPPGALTDHCHRDGDTQRGKRAQPSYFAGKRNSTYMDPLLDGACVHPRHALIVLACGKGARHHTVDSRVMHLRLR